MPTQTWPRFRCLLDEQPTVLVPQANARGGGGEPREVNQAVILSWVDPWPTHAWWVRRTGPAAWVTDPVTGTAAAFHLGLGYAELLERLIAERDIKALEKPARRHLTDAGILVDSATREQRRSFVAEIGRARAHFAEHGYAIMPGSIHPFQLGALRSYYRLLVADGALEFDDGQSLRYWAHNEPVARIFHRETTPLVAGVIGSPVRPSYVYSGAYVGGASLAKHIDREQCEYTISLCIDYWPDANGATPWPLQLETPSGELKVFQEVGDGLLFRGPQLPHFRDALPDGHRSTSLFLHYVDADFAGPLS